MFLKPTNPEEVSKIISGLRNNKAPGFDGITTEVLKMSEEILSPVLSELINRSFEHGIFPDCLKIAKVTPIPKTGNDREINNFRPISILPVVSKVFERAMCTLVYTYFERFNLLKSSQFGYRRKRSTVDAIIQIIEKIRDDDQFLCNCLFLDLSKAFDTLDHLNHSLFLIYMNDLDICTFFLPTFSADDTDLRISTSTANYNEDQIIFELAVIEEWFKLNKLILNGLKTKKILFVPQYLFLYIFRIRFLKKPNL